jgi:hypothetical protein
MPPEHGRDVAHNWTWLSFNPPNRGYANVGSLSEIILAPI